MVFPILGGNSVVAGGYAIDNSLRFEQSYLSRTPSSSTTAERQKFTFSFWMKKRYNADNQFFIIAGTVATNDFGIYLSGGHNIQVFDRNSGGYHSSNRVLRDDSAWYHICVCVDTTESTAQDRCKIWINGELDSVMYTAFTLNNSSGRMNGTYIHYIGQRDYTTNKRFTGYMAEVYMVTGQALTYADFTEFDENSGILKPKEYEGTLTGNSFYLDFENSGSLGADQSGNGNNFTPTNLASIDQTTDTPTNNFATLNSLATFTSGVLSQGNLKHTGGDVTISKGFSTQAVSSGKWYAEVKVVDGGQKSRQGVRRADYMDYNDNEGIVLDYDFIYLQGTEGGTNEDITDWSGNNNIIGIALNKDDNEVSFYLNGVQRGSTQSLANTDQAYCFFSDDYSGLSNDEPVWEWNFGNPPYTISSGNSDQNGYGNFEYTPPSGYLALCTQNLATELSPTIDDGSQYFNTVLWTGNSTYPRSITGVGFQPDFIWAKTRNQTYHHILQDVVRGTGSSKGLYSSSNGIEGSFSVNHDISSFDTDGFTISQPSSTDVLNNSGNTHVAWNWKAGSTSSNTDGDITTTVQASTTSGFSIVSWNEGAIGTPVVVGHGLGGTPEMIILKRRDGVSDWFVWHQGIGNGDGTNWLRLQDTSANLNHGYEYISNIGSSTVQIQGGPHQYDIISYFFRGIEGYSKFGKYTGNSSTDGVMVTTMFRPSFVIYKNTSSATDWRMFDNKRNSFNVIDGRLFPNTSDAENTAQDTVDFLSNGFKLRATNSGDNGSGNTYIYMAFAESPFVSSTGIPVTAR